MSLILIPPDLSLDVPEEDESESGLIVKVVFTAGAKEPLTKSGALQSDQS